MYFSIAACLMILFFGKVEVVPRQKGFFSNWCNLRSLLVLNVPIDKGGDFSPPSGLHSIHPLNHQIYLYPPYCSVLYVYFALVFRRCFSGFKYFSYQLNN